MINRRALLGATASLPFSGLQFLTPAASASADTEKTRFMKAAIRQIKEAASPPEQYWQDVILTAVCVPYPFADFDYYYTKGTLRWVPNAGQNFEPVTVPEGFCTDLTSVPQIFWSMGLPKTGRYAYAAIAHDFLYWTQTTTREEADTILYEAMKDTKVGSTTSWSIYQAVKVAGRSAWNANTRAKTGGEKRFLKIMPDETKLTSWADWKKDSSRFEK